MSASYSHALPYVALERASASCPCDQAERRRACRVEQAVAFRAYERATCSACPYRSSCGQWHAEQGHSPAVGRAAPNSVARDLAPGGGAHARQGLIQTAQCYALEQVA